MATELEHAWTRIRTWCAVNAPATAAALKPPASPDTRTSAEKSTGREWPSELHEWFTLHDGVSEPGVPLVPNYPPLSVEQSLDVWDSFGELMSEQYEASYFDPDARSIALGESEPAGREAMMFLPSFIPICGADDFYLFVDLRLGSMSGCVTGWDHTAADQQGPIWPSITAMVESTATALETSGECNGYRPGVHQGLLGWYYEP